jgi:hypothetical protein
MRLIDITVDEVSLVDKAANKRQFVLIKRDGEVKKEEVKVEETKPAAPAPEPKVEPAQEDPEIKAALNEMTRIAQEMLDQYKA